jgi:hypothetical protein
MTSTPVSPEELVHLGEIGEFVREGLKNIKIIETQKARIETQKTQMIEKARTTYELIGKRDKEISFLKDIIEKNKKELDEWEGYKKLVGLYKIRNNMC